MGESSIFMYLEAQGCEDPHEASLSPGNLKKCRDITVFGRGFPCFTVQDHRILYSSIAGVVSHQACVNCQ